MSRTHSRRILPLAVLSLVACSEHTDKNDSGVTGTDARVNGGGQVDGSVLPDSASTFPDGTREDGACARADVKVARKPATVWLAIDHSFDIGQPQTDSDPGPYPWQYIRDLLLGADGVVPALETSIRFGLVAPGMQPDAFVGCAGMMLHVDPALDNAATISAVYPVEASESNVAAPYYGLAYIRDQLASIPENERGNVAIILGRSSQGEHLCPEDFIRLGRPEELRDVNASMRPVDALVSELATLGAKTYVFAAAPSAIRGDAEGTYREARIAALGGTGSGPISYADPEQLKQAIASLSANLVDCTVSLNGKVADGQGCTGTVLLNDDALPCDDANGWVVTAPDEIELRGAACEMLRSGRASVIRASFPCDVIELL